jgi:hypothetical protein
LRLHPKISSIRVRFLTDRIARVPRRARVDPTAPPRGVLRHVRGRHEAHPLHERLAVDTLSAPTVIRAARGLSCRRWRLGPRAQEGHALTPVTR